MTQDANTSTRPPGSPVIALLDGREIGVGCSDLVQVPGENDIMVCPIGGAPLGATVWLIGRNRWARVLR